MKTKRFFENSQTCELEYNSTRSILYHQNYWREAIFWLELPATNWFCFICFLFAIFHVRNKSIFFRFTHVDVTHSHLIRNGWMGCMYLSSFHWRSDELYLRMNTMPHLCWMCTCRKQSSRENVMIYISLARRENIYIFYMLCHSENRLFSCFFFSALILLFSYFWTKVILAEMPTDKAIPHLCLWALWYVEHAFKIPWMCREHFAMGYFRVSEHGRRMQTEYFHEQFHICRKYLQNAKNIEE